LIGGENEKDEDICKNNIGSMAVNAVGGGLDNISTIARRIDDKFL